jgi:hypothetical protein
VKDRRATFFLLAAVLCLVLVPVAQERFRNLTLGVGGVYLLLSLASYLDFRSRH